MNNAVLLRTDWLGKTYPNGQVVGEPQDPPGPFSGWPQVGPATDYLLILGASGTGGRKNMLASPPRPWYP